MTIDPKEAASALGDVAVVERRTREALYYGGASSILILWGVAWAIGHTVTFAAPPLANTAWVVINIVGTVASLFIGFARSQRRARPWDWRLGTAFVVMIFSACSRSGSLAPRSGARFPSFGPCW